MGTRQVYEEKLRSGSLDYDPTIKPGLGSARCPRCLSLVNPNSGSGDWAITSVLHNATAVAGSGAGAMLGAVHGFNTGIPFVQKHVKGPKWLHLLIVVKRASHGATLRLLHCYLGIQCLSHRNSLSICGVYLFSDEVKGVQKLFLIFDYLSCQLPPLLMFSGACAAFGGYAVPKYAQLTVTSYYAGSSASHYAISQATRYVERLKVHTLLTILMRSPDDS